MIYDSDDDERSGRRSEWNENLKIQPAAGIHQELPDEPHRPTADTLYLTVREEFPNISLGTVYRNLNLLAELGEITRFSCGDGSEHFDFRTEPHYHFVCKSCGAIQDLPVEMVRDTSEFLTQKIRGRVDSHMIFFYGECEACLHKKS